MPGRWTPPKHLRVLMDDRQLRTERPSAPAAFRAVFRGAARTRKCFEDVLVRPCLVKEPGRHVDRNCSLARAYVSGSFAARPTGAASSPDDQQGAYERGQRRGPASSPAPRGYRDRAMHRFGRQYRNLPVEGIDRAPQIPHLSSTTSLRTPRRVNRTSAVSSNPVQVHSLKVTDGCFGLMMN